MDDRLGTAELQKIFGSRRGTIKAQLMNQDRIAGIGNVYADEILFQTGLHPATAPAALTEDDFKALHRTMRGVLRTCARKKAQVSKFPDGYLLPHRQCDRKCPNCARELKKMKVSGRTTWLCPHCQKKKSK